MIICERCGQRDATEHLSEITETRIRAGELCHECYIVELGPVSLEETRRWMSTEPYLTIDFGLLVSEWSERARVHGQELPREVKAFIERHARPSV